MNGKTINELSIGEKASFSKTITETDVVNYAGITGDFNPAHINDSYAKDTIFGERIAHGMLSTGLISAVLGIQLPGQVLYMFLKTLSLLPQLRLTTQLRQKLK